MQTIIPEFGCAPGFSRIAYGVPRSMNRARVSCVNTFAMKNAKGFTLIELLMVIALIAIVSTLAVNKVGAVREAAARKVSLANQKAVERAVEAYLAEDGKLNKLDSLIYAGDNGAPIEGTLRIVNHAEDGDFNFDVAKGIYLGPTKDDSDGSARANHNSGVTPSLSNILCRYALSQKQVEALETRLGLKFVMAHTDYANADHSRYMSSIYPKGRSYGDDTYPTVLDGLNANDSACVATRVSPKMTVAAVTPISDLGREIYLDCGQDLPHNNNYWGETYDKDGARGEVDASGGPLIAFGLGDCASIVGKSDAGLDAAPYATFVQKNYYSRYILLFRLKTIGTGSVSQIMPEFAGVLDPDGNTIRAAQHIIKNL